MISGILIFFLFLGPLVFFHELGHFLLARFFGVRVETFSIGFGPKLFNIKRGDTVYAFSAIPLGGYVKMFGDDPLSEEELTEEEKKVAYTHKSKWARFWIVFGGPLANFILAFVIYFGLAATGEQVPEAKLGNVKQEAKLYEVGLRTGDTLTKVNGKIINSFDDLSTFTDGLKSLTVSRLGEELTFEYKNTPEGFQKDLVAVLGMLRAPIFTKPDGTFLTLKKKGFDEYLTLEEIYEYPTGDFELYEQKSEITQGSNFNAERATESGVIVGEFSVGNKEELISALKQRDLYPIELMINNISNKSAASNPDFKLRKGEIIVGIAGKDLYDFEEFRQVIQDLKEEKPVEMSVLGKEGLRSFEITPKMTGEGENKVLLVGITSGVIVYSRMTEQKASGIFEALSLGVTRTYDGTLSVAGMFKKLIFGEVSVKNLGGPIAIGKAANDYFDMGAAMFLRLMALISINLAVINLFPIPVLDGGHIVFIFLEIINGGPISRKKMMYAQQFGMSLLFLLIFVALFNDFKRYF